MPPSFEVSVTGFQVELKLHLKQSLALLIDVEYIFAVILKI
ncbi:MAG: hypothetical protein ACOCQ1_00925 [Halanaerobiaceae bacterium]